MTKAKLTRIPKRVLACVLAVLMVLSCLTMLPFTGFAAVQHLDIETPAVVQDKDGKYYAFGNAGAYYTSNDLTQWSSQQDYLGDGAIDDINLLYGHLGTVTRDDLKSPEVVQIGGTYYLYLSIMKGSTSMIVRAPSKEADNPGGPYADFDAVLETGFARNDSTGVIQGYFDQAYASPSDKPDDVAGWGRGTCYYFSNFLGFNYQWFTEELPRAYAPSITQVGSDYYMVYGYRNGGIWLQKLQSNGLIDFTWSGDNWNQAGEDHRYTVEDSYDQESLVNNGEIFDPYFGQLLVPTTEAGDTDTTASSVSRAGEEPELYVANGQVYLQVTYGGPDNSDGYNVRSYTKVDQDVGGVTAWNFVDMNNNSAWRNVSGNLISGASTTGHKLMGDYNLPGTADGLYYTSPGASSVVRNNDGMWLYNYQVKLNDASNGTVADPDAEMRSHILLNNRDGDPLVTPFEYAGDSDSRLYNDAFTTQYSIDEGGAAQQVSGQYYVTMSGTDTSTGKSSLTGITLTAGHVVSGAISGSWQFEDITINGQSYPNGVVITDGYGNEYHGAFLAQTVEDPSSLDNNWTTTMTFTLATGNQTIWGVWYDDYQPSSENNTDAGLEVSSAIYTGGALQLNAEINGQLGMKYGNYISALRFAQNDYSTYLMIDDEYNIKDVVDYAHQDATGIEHYYVQPDGDQSTYTEIINSVYAERRVDGQEVGSSTSADQNNGNPGTNQDNIDELVSMLSDKADEARDQGKKLYILSGYLDSGTYGRNAHMDTDKGDITLYVTYEDTRNPGVTYSERVYSHVYQQPVPANVSGAAYAQNGNAWQKYAQNSVFLRAEGSYSTDSYLPGGQLRNETMRNGSKYFAAYATFGYYNNSLFSSSRDYGTNGAATNGFYHGNLQSILEHYTSWGMTYAHFNEDAYRPDYRENVDIAVSYERTVNDDESDHWNLIAGPRAMYYIDISSPTTSNIGSYYKTHEDGTGYYSIPLYYSSIYNYQEFSDRAKVFNWHQSGTTTGQYSAGLYPSNEYGLTDSSPLGSNAMLPLYDPAQSRYAFKADFSQVEQMYKNWGTGQAQLKWDEMSYSANILINADMSDIQNTQKQSYGQANTNDYNFYVRTRSESEAGIPGNNDDPHIRLIEDMEYGIYVTDKSYLRNYYNEVVSGKEAGGYTYYSWETFRKATRVVENYLNNYMNLADSYTDSNTVYNPDNQHELNKKDEYDQYLAQNGWTLDEVLDIDNNNYLQTMLSENADQVQDIYCYLLHEAADRLFKYNYYGDFMAAYEEYTMLNNYAEYTSSSWQQYLDMKNNDIVVGDQTLTGLSFADLAGYAYAAHDNPEITPTDPSADDPVIYDPTADSAPSKEGVDNDSWKIINDYVFRNYNGVTAKQVFLAATEQINAAIEVLRNKADYDALDSAYEKATGYVGNATIEPGEREGELDGTGIAGTTGSNIFSIDRSTVAALANSMNQGTTVQNPDGDPFNYVSDGENQYTISAMAAFDKIYSSIWELTPGQYPDGVDQAIYADLVSAEGVTSTTCDPASEEGQYNSEFYYSDQVRDDQQRYADTDDGKQSTDLSEVQTKINDKAQLLQTTLNWLYSNQITRADLDTYETFDYLIDVISSIDFNAYSPAGQELLWNTLYDMLVNGEVYSVNQQLFSEVPEGVDENDPMAKVLYDGDKGYYTGLNATNVDRYTTDLMELLTKLDTENDEDGVPYKKTYNVTFTVHYEDLNGVQVDTKSQSFDNQRYGEGSVTLKIDPFDPSNMAVRRWTITTTNEKGQSVVSNIRTSASQYVYTSNENAQIDVYVTQGMASTDMSSLIPVTVTSAVNDHNALSLWLEPEALNNYSVTVDGDKLTIHDTATPNGLNFSTTAVQVPFYAFNCWTVSGKAISGENLTLADLLGSKDSITITADYNITKYQVSIYVNDHSYASSFNTSQTIGVNDRVNTLPGEFFAWLTIEDQEQFDSADPDYKIASYNNSFTFDSAHINQKYVQVNYDTDDNNNKIYYIYNPNADGGYIELTSDDMYTMTGGSPDDQIDEIDATSLYYRLDHHYRDSWSYVSDFDPTSRTIMLYGHYTDAEGIKGAVEVEQKGLLYAYTANGTPADQLTDKLVDGNAGVQKLASTANVNGASEGEYSMYLSFGDRDYSTYDMAVRSYVTYKCTVQEVVNGETVTSTVYRTAYSDVKVVDLAQARAVSTN